MPTTIVMFVSSNDSRIANFNSKIKYYKRNPASRIGTSDIEMTGYRSYDYILPIHQL